MRVLVNTLVALAQRTGIGHYAAELVQGLRAELGAAAVATYPHGWMRRLSEAALALRRRFDRATHARSTQAAATPRTGKRRGLFAAARQASHTLVQRHFRRAALAAAPSLYHEPNTIPFACDVPTVATIPDLSLLLYPEWHPADRVAHFERHFAAGLARCRHVLAISEHGRQELMQVLGLKPEQVTRTYLGVREGFRVRPAADVAATLRSLRLPERYLLYVSTIEPRKNVLRLLQAYCALPAATRERWPLLLVGGWGWNAREVADFLHDEARHRGVRHVGYLSEAAMPAVYNGARALLYPSHYEGFGLPPLEMMACGGAVLASTAGAVAEVCGRHAQLIHPEDTDGWRDAMLEVTENDDWHARLRSGVVAHAAAFTWRRCVLETRLAYERALGVRQRQAA